MPVSYDVRKRPGVRTVAVNCLFDGESEFTRIQDAINYAASQGPTAAAPWVVLLYPGVYEEQITGAAYVKVIGVDKSSVIIQQNDAWIVTLANGMVLANVTLRLVAPTAGRYLIRDPAVPGVPTSARVSDVVFEVTTPDAFAHRCLSFAGSDSVYTIERCSHNIGGTGQSLTVGITWHTVTVDFIDNDFNFANANAYHIFCTHGATIRGMGNRWRGTCAMFLTSNGTIVLSDEVLCTGTSSVTGTARPVIQREPNKYRVLAGMRVGDALALATAGTRTTIEIGPGISAESNLTMKNLVDLVGDDPENCQIVANAAGVPIINVPTGVACTIQGLRVENQDNTGTSPAITVSGTGSATARNCYLKEVSPAAAGIGPIRLTGTGTTSVWDSVLDGGRYGVRATTAATLYCRNCRFVAAAVAAVGCLDGVAFTATLEHCDLTNRGVIVNVNGTINLRHCSQVGAVAQGYAGTYNLTHCSGVGLSPTGGTVVASCCAISTISGGNSATTSITLDEGCSISGAITNIHASATLILPRKRLGAGLRAPGLLATGTQMDSVAGAGAPINQAPATRQTTDNPRSVQVVHVGANSGFPYNVTMTGYDIVKGILVLVTEVIAVTGAGTFPSVKAWHRITNWATSGNIAAGDTIALQFGDRQGLEHRLRDTTHLLYCYKSPGGAAPVSIPPASFTLDLTNQTVRETGVAVIAGDAYEYLVVKG